MSGDFPRFPELQFLRDWFAVWPGDCATRTPTDESILARNAACTPFPATHIAKEWMGTDGGETGL